VKWFGSSAMPRRAWAVPIMLASAAGDGRS
jgi:hypothetical protein